MGGTNQGLQPTLQAFFMPSGWRHAPFATTHSPVWRSQHQRAKQEKTMKGAEAYVNDQWQSCGLADLPQGSGAQAVKLHFIVRATSRCPG